MSERESELKLQAYLDDELQPGERQTVEAQLAAEPDYARLLKQLKGVDAALVLAEEGVCVPETREFYWSKIESAIGRVERLKLERHSSNWLTQWRQWLMPAGAVAGLALALFLAVYSPTAVAPHLEASLSDPAAFTYRDFARGTTLVWLSYPADSENEIE
jgi:anti-sigma factor RsiW